MLGITYLRTPSTRETRVKVHQLCGPHEAYSISCAHADMDTSRVDSDIYSSYPQPAAGAGTSQCTYELQQFSKLMALRLLYFSDFHNKTEPNKATRGGAVITRCLPLSLIVPPPTAHQLFSLLLGALSCSTGSRNFFSCSCHYGQPQD